MPDRDTSVSFDFYGLALRCERRQETVEGIRRDFSYFEKLLILLR